ncbi:MAG: ribose 5-phosphate isomerase B [Prevotellaceae bacterium]|jgi:ribose 5-phosphate isomerase B|nr:ribose 5-phosphate isomerase B [Prevotellaceae bacterium]
MKNLKIALANDHAGFCRKNEIRTFLEGKVAEIKDFGCFSTESCDYPDYAHPLATAVENGEFDFGITVCGSGNGINMVVNKHQGIRGALCWNVEIAKLARQHNNANVMAIPGRFVSKDEAIAMVDAFLNTAFEGGRHQLRIDKIPMPK